MSMKKKIVVETKDLTIVGPTDYNDSLIETLVGKKVFRSDYLDKLTTAIEGNDSKYEKTFAKFPKDKLITATGYDADHPFVTKEGSKFRAWRYLAYA